MRSILILALKDLKVMIRDRLAAFFYLVFPVLYAILIGYLMSGIVSIGIGIYRGTVSLAVVDEAQSEQSKAFLEHLGTAKELKIHTVNLEAAKDAVRRRSCTGYLILQKGFGDMSWLISPGGQPQMRLVTDQSQIAEGQIVRGMVYMQLMNHVRSLFLNNLTGDPEQNAKLRAVIRAYLNVDTQINPRLKEQLLTLLNGWQRIEENQSVSDSSKPDDALMATDQERFKNITLLREIFPITFPAGTIWAMLFSAAFFAVSIVEERTEGTLQRLRMAPLRRFQLLLGKGFACMLNSLVASLALIILGISFFEIRPDSYSLLLSSLLCAIVCFSGMMMLLASLGKTPASAAGISMATIIVLAMLGGAAVPEVIMPPFAKTISNYIPVKWAIMAIEGPIRRDFSFSEMVPFYLKLITFGTACYVAGVLVFRRTEN
jgi:ABC-2 type transport system permease protein